MYRQGKQALGELGPINSQNAWMIEALSNIAAETPQPHIFVIEHQLLTFDISET